MAVAVTSSPKISPQSLKGLLDERVVAGLKAQVGIGRHSQHPATVDVGRAGRQRRHHLALLNQAVDGPTAQRLVMAWVRALGEPGVELQLEVKLVGERPGGRK